MDFLSAAKAKLQGVPDPEVLAFAAEDDRILVTSDLRTMPRHFANFLEAHGDCPGVFLVKQRAPLAETIEALVMVWAASDADEWKNRLVEIPRP
jgi:predicted nuclease of predicted toxin-antitoxin system